MLPINHLLKRLKLRLGDFEFLEHPRQENYFRIRLHTGLEYFCAYKPEIDRWTAYWLPGENEVCERMTGLLNGHTRDEAGNLQSHVDLFGKPEDNRVEDGWQVIENPPPKLIIEAGDEYWSLTTQRWCPCVVSIGQPVWQSVEVGNKLRRRVDSPMMAEPDREAV